MRLPLPFLYLCLPALTGCAAHQIQNDNEKIRATLLNLYTNQVMDNLVRASNGLPIIQLDYTNASATVTVENTASLNNVLTTTNNNVLTMAAAPMLVLTRTTMNLLTGGLGANNTNNITIMANPMLTNNEVYNDYLTFLGNPGQLEITCNPPPAGAAHICQKFGDEYYWVPVQHKQKFLDLALVTMGQRDRLLEEPKGYIVTMLKVDKDSEWDLPVPKKNGVRTAEPLVQVDVDIDKGIPNNNGMPNDNGAPGERHQDAFWTVDNVSLYSQGFDALSIYRTIQKDVSCRYYLRQTRPKSTDPLPPAVYYYYYDQGSSNMVFVDKTTPHKPISRKWIPPNEAWKLKSDRFVPNNSQRFFVTTKLRVLLTKSCYERLKTKLPYRLMVKLDGDSPPAPTTSELLDRIPFRGPQVKFEQPSNSHNVDDCGTTAGTAATIGLPLEGNQRNNHGSETGPLVYGPPAGGSQLELAPLPDEGER